MNKDKIIERMSFIIDNLSETCERLAGRVVDVHSDRVLDSDFSGFIMVGTATYGDDFYYVMQPNDNN
jgi:hypothetical protein